MEYIQDQDLFYLKNKYHDDQKPFDPFVRFLCHDAAFDPSTGLSEEEILKEIRRVDAAYSSCPRAVRKARAFETVLKNTRIAVNPHDYFVGIHCIGRPLNRVLINEWNREVLRTELSAEHDEMQLLHRTGAVTIWPDYDHSVPVWDRLLSLGFSGILREAAECRARLERERALSREELGYYESIEISYQAILTLLSRMISLAESMPEEEKSNKTPKTVNALKRLREGAPETMYEALLLIYLYFICSEHIEGLQVRSLSNLDVTMLPFYQKDLANGCTEEELREILAYFFMQFSSIGNYWNQPVYFGGTAKDGSTLINAFSYLALDVYDRMGLYNPKLQIKLAPNTPDDFLKKALDMIRRGHSSIVFVCEGAIRRAMMAAGFAEEDARTCDLKGCYEFTAKGAMETNLYYVNLVKPLEYVLHNGRDGITGEQIGPQTGEAETFQSYDELYRAYLLQLDGLLDRAVRLVNRYESFFSQINPQPLSSATVWKSVCEGKDIYAGGAKYNNSNLSLGFIATVADSLTMIRKYVYEKKQITLPQLRDILDRDWEGHDALRLVMRRDPEKYGNNLQRPDECAVAIAQYASRRVSGKPNSHCRGGSWSVGLHVARMYLTQGAHTQASANGRKNGEELSKNASATAGCNYGGATAQVLSISKFDAAFFRDDLPVDLALLPSAVSGEDGLSAMLSLVRTFDSLGGMSAHFNVFDAQQLRMAQKDPERYADLQIRVCGWNVLFRNMSREEQEAYIRQAEALE